ncbi:MAG: hypothetical protein PHD82_10095 [Candidatus Riflebacteria bacterium]|nr:hypothetical protein [Candidatus Riflebacteria bacterium]
MENCSMKRGFFFLRPCDHPAHQQCSVCGRYFCAEHLRINPGKNEPVCLDCLGKEMQKPQNREKNDDEIYEPTWCYGYRHSYYSGCHYRPWYLGRRGSADNDNFDGHETRFFDSEVDDNFDDDPNAEDSSFDS